MLPLSLALIFITATFILLSEQFKNLILFGIPLFLWGIPVVSLLVGAAAIVMVNRMLRRKEYARA